MAPSRVFSLRVRALLSLTPDWLPGLRCCEAREQPTRLSLFEALAPTQTTLPVYAYGLENTRTPTHDSSLQGASQGGGLSSGLY